jgi:1-pyrroline-5-carboxylate dehydrogenase
VPEYRALEGFIYAVSPFNFTAIGANLPATPAMMGNTVVWKPAHSAMLSNYYVMKLFEEAGLPPGVINLVAGDPVAITRTSCTPDLRRRPLHRLDGGLQQLLEDHRRQHLHVPQLPAHRGETGGKDFIVVHPSADPEALARPSSAVRSSIRARSAAQRRAPTFPRASLAS